MTLIERQLLGLWSLLRNRLVAGGTGQRGDVPGWVLVTIMTAGLVAAPVYCAWLTRELRGGRWI